MINVYLIGLSPFVQKDCLMFQPILFLKIYQMQAWLDHLGPLWVSLNYKNATSPCWWPSLDRERHIRRLCPHLWDRKAWLWLIPFPSQHWLSCHHPPTQSPGLARPAPDSRVRAATVDPTAAGPGPRSEMRKSNAALLSDNGGKSKLW